MGLRCLVEFENPICFFSQDNATFDIAPLYDWNAFNAGFLFVRATEAGIAVYNQSCYTATTEPKTNDQIALNRAIW